MSGCLADRGSTGFGTTKRIGLWLEPGGKLPFGSAGGHADRRCARLHIGNPETFRAFARQGQPVPSTSIYERLSDEFR